MIFTAVVLVVRHKSISFSPEKKNGKRKSKLEQLNRWKVHSVACLQSKRSIPFQNAFCQSFLISPLSSPGELVTPEI